VLSVSTRHSALAAGVLALTVAAGLAGSVAPGATTIPTSADRAASLSWRITPTGSSEEFRGLAAVNRTVAWVSGEAGSVLRTTDGGRHWTDVSPPAAKGLALRDIEAWSSRRAVVLSIGPGEQSRIFSTRDGGRVWKLRFRNPLATGFFDCMAFSRSGRGLALSDPVNGHFRLAVSADFGRSWHLQSTAGMPRAEKGEFGFAASGTCIVAISRSRFVFLTGGVAAPRVFTTTDGGRAWTATDTTMRGGPSAGTYSAAFRDRSHGVLVGGDYTAPANGSAASAYLRGSHDGWRLSKRFVHGYRSGVAFVSRFRNDVLAVGPTGSDVSRDGGRTWSRFDRRSFDSVECARDRACWASGTHGKVARLVRH
jgi:photosystem II stability/assembly factor-like uncharacterized protein